MFFYVKFFILKNSIYVFLFVIQLPWFLFKYCIKFCRRMAMYQCILLVNNWVESCYVFNFIYDRYTICIKKKIFVLHEWSSVTKATSRYRFVELEVVPRASLTCATTTLYQYANIRWREIEDQDRYKYKV